MKESVARMPRIAALLTGFALVSSFHLTEGVAEYYGRFIGPLSRLLHSVSGDVYAVDARTLHIRDFTYDGEGPAAYFYAGNTKTVGPGGFTVRDESGSNGVLKRYNKKHITITLPEGKTLNNIKWFSVWCEEFQVNFGDVQIPRGLDFPKPQKIGALAGVHGVSSESIVVVDAQTLLIPSFSYDGEAPDAKFWVGRGPKPSPQGIRVPDENGKQNPLRRYDRKTIVLTLPGDLTIFDIGHFGIWCEAFTVDFGHVQIPQVLNVPPSLKMLGVSPQKRSPALQQTQIQQIQSGQPQIGFENVLPLFNIQVRPTTYRPPTHRFAPPTTFQPKNENFQIQTSVSLTAEPIVYTQIGNQPLQRAGSQVNANYAQPNFQQFPQYRQNFIQQTPRFNSLPQNLVPPRPLLQRQYFAAPANLIQQPQYIQQPPLHDLPNPYHELVQRRIYQQQQQQYNF